MENHSQEMIGWVWGVLALLGAVMIWLRSRRRRRTQRPSTSRWNGWQEHPESKRNAWAESIPETDSPIEEMLLQAIRQIPDLPEPQLQLEIREGERLLTTADMAYPDQKIAIYVDSRQFHANIGQLIEDARKRNRLSIFGWTVLVYWGPQIHRYANGCAKEIREAYLEVAGRS